MPLGTAFGILGQPRKTVMLPVTDYQGKRYGFSYVLYALVRTFFFYYISASIYTYVLVYGLGDREGINSYMHV